MILQALTQLYEDLVCRGESYRFGWGPAKISYALCLGENGQVLQAIPTLVESTSTGGKTVLRPQIMALPAAVIRTVGVLPNFLWDNASYILGADDKGKPERSKACFQASRELHHRILDPIDSPVARAILAFFDTWDAEQAFQHPALMDCWEDLRKGANLVFRVDGRYGQDEPEIQAAWDTYYSQNDGAKAQCLVTGKPDIPEAVHPLIKGVAGAQSSGAAIVSFNAPAFCSYGKEQSFNAPVGRYAAFAYTTALNHLLADRDHVQRIGQTTIICWAEGANPSDSAFAAAVLFGGTPPQGLTDDMLRSAVKRLADGLPCEELNVDPNRQFFILGLSPNSARISVRFFYRDTLGAIMKNVNAHHSRLEIVGNPYPMMPLWAMLRETVNMNTTDKAPSPVMAGAVARAIFSGTPYPASLLEATMQRIRAERNITPGRAAILKAYYLKNSTPQCPEEVLKVSLNQTSTNIPYTLGRLFAIYEAVQEQANPGINATIKDKYFNSAASTPATIFPILDNLCQKHMRKLPIGLKISYDREIGKLKDILSEAYPLRLTLPEQGSFNLGYYHQKQARYTKKEEK